LSGEKTLRTKRLTELLNQPIIYVKQKGTLHKLLKEQETTVRKRKDF